MKSTPQPIRIHSWLFSLLVSLVLVIEEASASKPLTVFSSPFALHTSGSHLLNIANQPVSLSGVNWFGFETAEYAPHGLSIRNWQSLLDQVKRLGYNVIRLPFSDAMLASNVMPTNINDRRKLSFWSFIVFL